MTALERLDGRRILFLNWRDTRHPDAGGAEEYVDQIATRFAAAGAHVTVFAAEVPGTAPLENTHGYVVARDGGRFGVYLAGAAHASHFRHTYDAIVDCQNGIPFFAPLYVSPPTAVVCVVHHVHQRQWGLYFPWPTSAVGRLLEKQGMQAAYRHVPLVAVSPSTREELRRVLHLDAPVYIVPNGVSVDGAAATAPTVHPSIAVVTRLVPHKQMHLLVDAVPELLRHWPDLSVDIAGSGPELSNLERRARSVRVDATVRFHGFVDEGTKAGLLSRAWTTVAPSIAEGWGLTVLEANSLGTPAVAFDVPGLRDSVVDGRTGWLLRDGDLTGGLQRSLARLADRATRREMGMACRAWAASFSWDRSAEKLGRVVLSEIALRTKQRHDRRSPVDLSTTAELEDRPGTRQLLEQRLRVTDEARPSGSRWQVLLHGCDELGAVRALGRADVEALDPRLATRAQVLSGLAGGSVVS